LPCLCPAGDARRCNAQPDRHLGPSTEPFRAIVPHSWKILIGAVALFSSCTSSDEARPAAGAAGEAYLVPSFYVHVAGDTVQFELLVANGGRDPAVLEFPTSQRYDFAVMTESGDTLWLWSREMMFAQAVGSETIAPGQELQYRAIWDAAGHTGLLRAAGMVVTRDPAIALETEFEVPGV
jgi:Intracellular proteinase inhibitor